MARKVKSKTTFADRVYECLRRVPSGQVTTYKDLAAVAGSPRAARAVGNAMNANPDAPRTPCHRVVASDGSLGGYRFGLNKKVALLKKEGVEVEHQKIINLKKFKHQF